MIKKIIILALALCLMQTAIGIESIDIIIDQETLDAIDVDTVDLMYIFDNIFLDNLDGDWTLWTRVHYLNAYPIGNGNYEIQYTYTDYKYTDIEFFDCLIHGNETDIFCFETYIIPVWVPKFSVTDFLQRRYLKSLQTGGEPMLSSELETYLLQ